MKIVLPGGSGQVGTILARAFHARGHDVVVLSRQPYEAPWRVAAWDGETLGSWQVEIDGSDAVVNLAGSTVNCRYTAANRKKILDSRVNSTRVVGSAIAAAARPPRVWLQASTATIYAHRFDAPNDEASGILGGGEPDAPATWRFSIDVARAWERELAGAPTPRTRKVALRSAMVMSPDRGGVFAALLGLVRRGLGGSAGNGRQFVSWIHHRDFVRAIALLMERDDIAGAVNVAAPGPLPYAAFMRELRASANVGFGLPAAGPLLEIGALVMRTETELILKSRRVIPGRLCDAGFTFDFPTWAAAANDLCHTNLLATRTPCVFPIPRDESQDKRSFS